LIVSLQGILLVLPLAIRVLHDEHAEMRCGLMLS
jgi:hypothetical protein